MKTRFLSSTAVATLMLAPIAGIAAWQLMQLRETSPTIVGQTELAEVKQDTGKDSPAGGKIVAADKKAVTPAASPAKPAELAKERVDLGASGKAKSEADALVRSEGEEQFAPAVDGGALVASQNKMTDAPADAKQRLGR